MCFSVKVGLPVRQGCSFEKVRDKGKDISKGLVKWDRLQNVSEHALLALMEAPFL